MSGFQKFKPKIIHREGRGGYRFEVVDAGHRDRMWGVYPVTVRDKSLSASHIDSKKATTTKFFFGPIKNPYVVECSGLDDLVRAQGAFKDLLIARPARTIPQTIDRVAILVGRPDRVSAATAQEGLEIAGKGLIEESDLELDAIEQSELRSIGFDELFKGEVQVAQQIKMHYNGQAARLLPQLLDHDLTDIPYMVQVFVDGKSLTERVIDAELDRQQTWTVVGDISHSLALLHRLNWVHQDCKPTNIKLQVVGEEDKGSPFFYQTTLLDLSNTQKVGPEDLVPSLKRGSFWIWAPEQVQDIPMVSQRSDVWAWGVTAAMAYTGYHPLTGHSVQEIQEVELHSQMHPGLKDNVTRQIKKGGKRFLGEVPSEDRDIIARSLHQDPMQRPTAEQIKEFYEKNRPKAKRRWFSFDWWKPSPQEDFDESIGSIEGVYAANHRGAARSCEELADRIKQANLDPTRRRELLFKVGALRRKIVIEFEEKRYGKLRVYRSGTLGKESSAYRKLMDEWDRARPKGRVQLLPRLEEGLVQIIKTLVDFREIESMKEVLEVSMKRYFSEAPKSKRRLGDEFRHLALDYSYEYKDFYKAEAVLSAMHDQKELYHQLSGQTRAVVLCELGDVLMDKGNYDGAREAYKKAWNGSDEGNFREGITSRVIQRLGVIAALKGQTEKGLEFLMKASEGFKRIQQGEVQVSSKDLGPTPGMSWTAYWTGVAYICQARGYARQAETGSYHKSLRQARDHFSTAAEHFDAIRRKPRGDDESDEQHMVRLRVRGRDASWARYQKAKVQLALGELDEVEEGLSGPANIQEIPEMSYFVGLHMARLRYRQGRYETSLREINIALDQFLQTNYSQTENFRQAAVFLSKAINLYGDLERNLKREIIEKKECVLRKDGIKHIVGEIPMRHFDLEAELVI